MTEGPGIPIAAGSDMSMATVAAILAVFAFGMVMVFPGSVKLRLAERIRIDDAQMGRIIALWQFTTLILTLVAGPLLDGFGHKPVLIAGFLLVSAGIWCFAAASHFSGAFLGAVLLGVGGSCVNTGGNTLLPALNPSNPAAASNLGNVFFGMGAFVVPFAVSYLFKRMAYTPAVASFGVLTAAAAVPALLAVYPQVSSGYQLSVVLSLLSHPAVLLGGFMLFCAVGLQVSVASWTTTYLRKVGFDEYKASVLFSLFWIAMIAARLIASRLVTTSAGASTVQFAALAAAAALLLMTLTMNRPLASLCILALGLCLGPVFPTTVGVTFSKFTPALYGSVFALIYAVGLAGSSVVPGLIGYYSKTRSIHAGYRLMVALAVVLFVLAWQL